MLKPKVYLKYIYQLPTPLLAFCIGLISLLLIVSGWFLGLKPIFLDNRANYQHSQVVAQQLLRAKHDIQQIPLLTRQLQSLHEVPIALSEQITQTALAKQIFISELTEKDREHEQAILLGSFSDLQAFLQTLSQQRSPWLITELQFRQSRALDSPIALHINWQMRRLDALPAAKPCSLKRAKTVRDPFQAVSTTNHNLTRYSVAQIEWLGVFQTADHTAALIRLPNHFIGLITRSAILGQEQWRLQHVTPSQAQFIDSEQRPHQLRLHLEPSFTEALS